MIDLSFATRIRSHSDAYPPRLLDQVPEKLRLKHYSIRTEQAYLDWIKRFILFHGKKHPAAMAAPEVGQKRVGLYTESGDERDLVPLQRTARARA